MAWIMRELKAMSGGHPVAEVCSPFRRLGMLAQTDRLGSSVLVVSCRAPVPMPWRACIVCSQ
jgi:hypothetical protein